MNSRKLFFVLCSTIFASALVLGGCKEVTQPSGSVGPSVIDDVTEYTVTFDSRGGSAVAAQTVKSGEKVTKPANPTKSGFTFDAWYEDTYLATPYDFNTPVTSNFTLYAGWNTDEVPPDPPVPEEYDFFVSIGGIEKGLSLNSDARLLDGQTAEYMAEYTSVTADSGVVFKDAQGQEISENIGPDEGDNNVYNDPMGRFLINNDADNVQVYFKTWGDGGHSFFITGYDNGTPVVIGTYYLNYGGQVVEMHDDSASIVDGQTGQYWCGLSPVTAGELIYFEDANHERIYNIGSEPEDEFNHNNVDLFDGNYYIHSSSEEGESVDFYLKTWSDGGYSFWVTGYKAGTTPIDEHNYYVSIGDFNDVDLVLNEEASLASGQLAEYVAHFDGAIYADEEIIFTKDGAIMADNIGPDAVDNNNAGKDESDRFIVLTDATNADIYLKVWSDGGYSFWLSGFSINYAVNISGIDFDFELNESAVLAEHQTAEYYVEVGFLGGDNIVFERNHSIIYNIGPDANSDGHINNVYGDAENGFFTHNEASGVNIYLKTWEDGGYSFWVEGFAFENEYVYTATGLPDWIGNDGCVVFAYVWGDGIVASFHRAVVIGSQAKFDLDFEAQNFLLVRCAKGTTEPAWGENIYNQSGDVTCSSGVYTYSTTW